VLYCPALIWVKVRPPDTSTGTLEGVLLVVPLPSSPSTSYPQQYTAPVLANAQTCQYPMVIWVKVTPASTPPVYTATGVSCAVAVVTPFPSSPSLSSPQQ
jgi:hypothetical protein